MEAPSSSAFLSLHVANAFISSGAKNAYTMFSFRCDCYMENPGGFLCVGLYSCLWRGMLGPQGCIVLSAGTSLFVGHCQFIRVDRITSLPSLGTNLFSIR